MTEFEEKLIEAEKEKAEAMQNIADAILQLATVQKLNFARPQIKP